MSERKCPTSEKVQEMIDASGGGPAFPVGSVFLTVVDTDPATLLGYGTWQRIAQGQFLVGQSGADPDFDTAEETGGAKTHTHTDHTTVDIGRLASVSTVVISGAHNAPSHLPPYFVVYIWQRTA